MNKVSSLILGIFLIVNCTGCATILAGRTQTVMIETNPTGARCELSREGRIIGSVERTPGAVTLNKSKFDINISCTKEGYSDSKGFADSGTEGATFGNILAGGLIGWGVDSAAGADNKYPEVVTVNLSPISGGGGLTNNLSTGSTDDIRSRLQSIEQLRKSGVLTEQEYKKKRADLLNSL